ncbi:MAG: undecaprenyldiphospho-muramoylpentapeptide beta-N-acetylglucosaminyltransferase [Planctomycetota bacterium]|jgi:UDP-N-acetylglucosamine--N-acetylmuramyl-(pentapeptide) pyrophosphoryl-undecaprenol N-acetylglucosamine transferase
MKNRTFFFAGGGTGGHIYPALAVAEKIIELDPKANIHFFCSNRAIDSMIFSKTDFNYTALPAKKGFSLRPIKFLGFSKSLLQSYRIAKEKIRQTENPTITGVGGFVAAAVCLATHKLNIPVKLLNVDIVPGKANKLIGRFADEIFLQFEETAEYFKTVKAKINIVGCPLRKNFENPQPTKIKEQFELDKNKKILLVTGASSGSKNINESACSLLDKLSAFADSWQIVHLTGKNNYDEVKRKYNEAKITHKVLDYCDFMADLLSASDLVIGRSGAVSIAEYAACGVPSICMPYPYHKDRHQYLNAAKLVDAGAGIIVDDLPDAKERAKSLWEELEALLKEPQKLENMKRNCLQITKENAALSVAKELLDTSM